ncbi:CopD family protein, partial [Frigoribacterium sp. VKM Ac-2836]|uniref:copper resistance D family protein n=1 Tax=Frigoribacterium sp. VKM Ac-2836 TaxID=2739014 RepID=UPI0015673497|nr:CopD family protein [Frigoribacterium sp. VKM Ac-2836]
MFPSLLPLRPVNSLLVACVPLAVAATLVGLLVTGATTQTLIVDPGDLVTYGLPVARIVHDLAAALTIGLLVVAAFALPGQSRAPGVLGSTQFTAVRWAAWAAGVWFVAGSVVIVLTAAGVIGVPLSDPIFRRQLLFFATGLELGQSLLVSALCVLVVFVITYLTRSVSWTGAAAALSLLALLPLSLSGHAAGSDEHANAVNSLAIHLLGVTVWVGGLTALILLRKKVRGGLPVVAARYSALAGWSFVAVALSGVVNVSLRFTGIGDLVTTEYGLLVSAKILILVFLGVAGALHRRHV